VIAAILAALDASRRVDPRDGVATVVQVLYGHTSRVLGVAFSRGGQRLVSAGYDRTARIRDTTSWGHTYQGNSRMR
jgi:WD40 repeat protein